MSRIIGIFGPDNKERGVVYKHGDYYFADTNQRVPDEYRIGPLFKTNRKAKVTDRSISSKNLDDLRAKVFNQLQKKSVEAK